MQSWKRLLDALDVLTQSHINHAKRAFAAGASGILFSIGNANRTELSPADYARFSAPFDIASLSNPQNPTCDQ